MAGGGAKYGSNGNNATEFCGGNGADAKNTNGWNSGSGGGGGGYVSIYTNTPLDNIKLTDAMIYNVQLEFQKQIPSGEIEISNLEELKQFRDDVNNGDTYIRRTVKLTNDIDFGEENTTNWVPVGNATYNFNGTFNGQGHTISNLYINSTLQNQGLFGIIGNNGEVKDFKIYGSIRTTQNTCGRCGRN